MELETSCPRHQVLNMQRGAITLPATVSLPTTTATLCFDFRKQGNEDFGRERQLRDYKRANGIFFKYGDKYSKEHQCKKPMQLLTIEFWDFGEVLQEETLRVIDLAVYPN